MISSKKGQEEVVGFVVVVVLVAIVFVLLLGFSSHKPPIAEKTSKDLRQFLESTRVFTTECALTEQLPLTFKDTINACYARKTCLSRKKACDVLNSTAQELLAVAFPAGPDYPIKGTRFTIIYTEPPETKEDTLVSLSQGNCTTLSQRSADDFFPLGAGQITVRINLCY